MTISRGGCGVPVDHLSASRDRNQWDGEKITVAYIRADLQRIFLRPALEIFMTSGPVRLHAPNRKACALPWLAGFPRPGFSSPERLFGFPKRVLPRDSNIGQQPVVRFAQVLTVRAFALARTALAAWDLINGRLVRPFDLSLKLSKTYWIVCPKAAAMKPKIVTFRDWLLAEAADDTRCLKKMFASKP
jgi:DNA-binding transcriptional LysR family regulator